MNQETIELELLAQIPMFSQISPESLQMLQSLARLETFEEGELIFAEEQRGDRMFIVLDGAVRITREIPGVGEELLSVCRNGNYFGEISLLDDGPRSANARVTETAKLLSLRKADLEELMFRDGEFAREILWVLTRHLTTRLRETNEKLRALHQMNI